MLIDDHYLTYMHDYVDFAVALHHFRDYCRYELGNSLKEYHAEYEAFCVALRRIRLCASNDSSARMVAYPFDNRLSKLVTLESELARVMENASSLTELSAQLFGLLNWFSGQVEQSFRVAFTERIAREAGHAALGHDLYDATAPLLAAYKHDEAVVAAFKHLDRLLQYLTGTVPHEHYGEGLVNHAFAERDGVIQWGTNANEQRSLRNLFSGAYGVFRNLATHRTIDGHDGIFESDPPGVDEIITFVGLLEYVAESIHWKQIKRSIDNAIAPFRACLLPVNLPETWQLHSGGDMTGYHITASPPLPLRDSEYGYAILTIWFEYGGKNRELQLSYLPNIPHNTVQNVKNGIERLTACKVNLQFHSLPTTLQQSLWPVFPNC